MFERAKALSHLVEDIDAVSKQNFPIGREFGAGTIRRPGANRIRIRVASEPGGSTPVEGRADQCSRKHCGSRNGLSYIGLTSGLGQTEKHSARADVFRCSPNNRHSAVQPCPPQTSDPISQPKPFLFCRNRPLTCELSRSIDRECFSPAACNDVRRRATKCCSSRATRCLSAFSQAHLD
jgi:hypothetical protein